MKHTARAPKRILSLLLALLLTLTLLPDAALTADAATPSTVYYKNTGNWSTVYAYFFADNQPVGNAWPGAKMTNGGDWWSISVPSGATHIIFNNGSGSQTADLPLPTDGSSYYNNGWSSDGAAGTVTDSYTVAGEAGLCSTAWDVSNTANDMTLSSGVYTKVYTNVAAGTYEYKVAKDHSWNESYGNGSSNASVTVAESGSTVTITFDPSSKKVSATVTAPTAEPDPTPTTTYTVAGDAGLCGTAWDVSNTANDMTLSNGVYTKVYTDVAVGTYEYKVVKNHSWDESYGNGSNNADVTVDTDSCTVTVTFDPSTNKISVTVIAPAIDPTPAPTTTYTVAGSFLTPAWDPSVEANDMTLSDGTTYTKVYENVAKGNYEFKVVENRSWNTAYGDNGNNYGFTVAEDGSTVTITFDSDSKAITVDVKAPLYMNVNGKNVAVTAGANVLETLNAIDTSADWYQVKSTGSRVKVTDSYTFPTETAVYSNLTAVLSGYTKVGTSYWVSTGETLNVETNAENASIQWYAAGTAIEGATGAAYTVTDDVAGKKISAKVTTSYDAVTTVSKYNPTAAAVADITVEATNVTVTLNGEAKNTTTLMPTADADTETVTFVLTPAEGYYLSSVTYKRAQDTKSYTVKSGASSNGISYDQATGALTIRPAAAQKGDIVITATAAAAATKLTYVDSDGEHTISVSTLAEAAKQAAALTANGASNITVQLLQDVTVSKNAETGAFTSGSYILDLNGHTVTATAAYYSAVSVANGASLTIKDSAGNGSITCTNTASNNGAVKVNGGSLTVNSGSITSQSNAIYASSSSSVTVNGGTVSGAEKAIYAMGTASVTVNGGTLSSTKATSDGNATSTNSAIVLLNGTGSTLSITGGTITGADYDISVENTTATVALSGGTFPSGLAVNGAEANQILASGYCYETADNGTVTVVKDEVAPTITGVTDKATYYTSQKVTAADDKVLATVTVNGTPVEDPAAEITLDGNKVAEYTIVATDAAGNQTTVTVSMKPISILAEPIEELTPDNVELTDKTAIETVKANVAAIDTTNATEEEKAALAEITATCSALLIPIENVQEVIDMIDAIPGKAAPDNEKALAAEKAYDALSEHEKELVPDEKLAELITILTNYKITKGNGSKWAKKSGKTLSFTANGALDKFVGIEVDGKEVAEKYYTAKDGTTVIKLTSTYLETLTTGKHTITVCYTDGDASASFTVTKAASNAATGDTFQTAAIAVLFISAAMLAMLVFLLPKKFKKF